MTSFCNSSLITFLNTLSSWPWWTPFSGFCGAMVGARVSLYALRVQHARAAREKLGLVLLRIGCELERRANRTVEDILDDEYVQLLGASAEAALAFPNKAKKIREKTGYLVGSMPTIYKDKNRPRHSISYPNREDAKQYTEALLIFIGYDK